MDDNTKKMEELCSVYQESCRKQTKKRINSAVNDFIDNDGLDPEYKDKILSMVMALLKLR